MTSGERASSADNAETRRVSISLPAMYWRDIEHELRARGAWWLANVLVNTGSPVFSVTRASAADSEAKK